MTKTIDLLAASLASYYFDDDLPTAASECDFASIADFIDADLHDLIHNANLDLLIDDTHLTDDELDALSDFLNDHCFELALLIADLYESN